MFKKVFIEPFIQFKGLPSSVYILAIQRFVNSLGNFVSPFLIFFLSNKLYLDEFSIGKWLAILSLSKLASTFFSGILVDRFSRKFVLVSSILISSPIFIICAFLQPSITTIYLIILYSFIRGFSHTSTNAIMADITNPSNRKQSFSLLYLALNYGLAIGLTLGGLLYKDYWQFLFIGDAVTSILSIIPVIFFVKESKPTKEEIKEINESDREFEKEANKNILIAFLEKPFFLAFVFISFFSQFIYSQQSFITPLQLEELFTEELSSAYYGFIMSINTLVVIILTPFIISVIKNIKTVTNLIVANSLYFFGFGMMAFIDKMYLFYISTFIWTIGEIIAVINEGVYLSNHMPVNHRGKFDSLVSVVHSASRTLAPLLMGLYLQSHTISQGWILTASIAILAILGFSTLGVLENKKRG